MVASVANTSMHTDIRGQKYIASYKKPGALTRGDFLQLFFVENITKLQH